MLVGTGLALEAWGPELIPRSTQIGTARYELVIGDPGAGVDGFQTSPLVNPGL